MRRHLSKRLWLSALAIVCLSGCGGQAQTGRNGPTASPSPAATSAYDTPQASMPAPSFSKEQLKALGMPEDISEESLRSVIYTYGNQKIDMIIGMPAYWEQVKPEEAKENQCYFVLPADETNNTMFSISSYEETIKSGHGEDALLAYVQDQWQTYSDRLKTKAGYTLEHIEEIKTIQVGRYVGGMIRFETVHPEGTRTINHFIIWATDERIYWCTVSADPAYWVYAEDSVLDMLKDFVTFDDVGK